MTEVENKETSMEIPSIVATREVFPDDDDEYLDAAEAEIALQNNKNYFSDLKIN